MTGGESVLTRLDPQSLSKVETDILSEAVFEPAIENIHHVLNHIYGGPETVLFEMKVNGQAAAIAGIRRNERSTATLLHIAVGPQHRRQGIGRQLLASLIHELGLTELEAETDQDGVEFYQRCGFHIKSLGEKYSGVERFFCTWSESGDRRPVP